MVTALIPKAICRSKAVVRKSTLMIAVLMIAVCCLGDIAQAYQRGGRGGGGGGGARPSMGRGGMGGARPNMGGGARPSMPQARPAGRPQMPASRPSLGNAGRPSMPGGGMQRPPNMGANRPMPQPRPNPGMQQRPNVGSNRPSLGMGGSNKLPPNISRPGSGTGGGLGAGGNPGAGGRPGAGAARPLPGNIGGGAGAGGGGNRPNLQLPNKPPVNRPAPLPGGVGGSGLTRPGPGGSGSGGTGIGGGNKLPGNRPSLGGATRPAPLPGIPGNRPGAGGGERPGIGGNRPGGGGERPGLGENRPGVRPTPLPGRPGIGGNRPTPLPGNRPGIGTNPPTTKPAPPVIGGNRPNRPNRPGGGGGGITGPGGINRPGIGGGNSGGNGNWNRPDWNRPDWNRPDWNRPNNRPGWGNGNNNWGVGNGNWGNNNNININNNWNNNNWNNWNNNNFNRPAWDRPGWGGGWGGGWGVGGGWANSWHNNCINPHFHGWYNGCWSGYWGSSWYSPVVWGAAGWGLGAWTNSIWNTTAFANPYFVAPAVNTVQSVPYDYSQPVVVNNYITADATSEGSDVNANSTSTADPTVTAQVEQSFSEFDTGLEAFRAGNYQDSLKAFDAALRKNPGDPVLHEVRALALFATGDYNSAAAALNSLLASAPGMDWTTMSSLYGDTDKYTEQLRKLESFCKANPKNAASAFVLAYHYLVLGSKDSAVSALRVVVDNQPNDVVAKKMLNALDPKQEESSIDATVQPSEEELSKPQPEIDLVGKWTSSNGSSTITLSINEESDFKWEVNDGGKKAAELAGELATNGEAVVFETKDQGSLGGTVKVISADEWVMIPPGAKDDSAGIRFKRVP